MLNLKGIRKELHEARSTINGRSLNAEKVAFDIALNRAIGKLPMRDIARLSKIAHRHHDRIQAAEGAGYPKPDMLPEDQALLDEILNENVARGERFRRGEETPEDIVIMEEIDSRNMAREKARRNMVRIRGRRISFSYLISLK
jgi:hypothetical protein